MRVIEKGGDTNYLIQLIWKNLPSLPGKNYNIQWIPGHCNIGGNEAADKNADLGCSKPETMDMILTY